MSSFWDLCAWPSVSRPEAGSVVPWELCMCSSVCQTGVLASLSLQAGDPKDLLAFGEPGGGARAHRQQRAGRVSNRWELTPPGR